jgi:hypothetical protein
MAYNYRQIALDIQGVSSAKSESLEKNNAIYRTPALA